MVEKDCKSWFEGGHNISGFYTTFPDGGTPTEVSIYALIVYM